MLIPETVGARILQAGTWLLGLLFIVAAGLKALEFASFVQQIERYQLLPQPLGPAAGLGIILTETVLGMCCLAGFHPGKALAAVCALLALFLAATAARWGLLAGTSCGCFGSVSTGGPGSVMLHGSVLLAVAVGLIFLGRQVAGSMPHRRFRAATGVIAAVLLMFAVQPSASPVPRPAPQEEGLRVFMSATCSTCMSEARKVKELEASPALVPVRVFIGAEFGRQVKDFLKGAGVELEYTPLTFPQLARETRRVPTVQLFHGGKLLREWVGRVPSREEIRELLAAPPDATTDVRKHMDAGRL